MSVYKKIKRDSILNIYRDIVDQYLWVNRENRIKAGLYLKRCNKKDLFLIVYELSIRGFGAKWKNSCEIPGKKSQLSKRVRIHWTEKGLFYENNETYQVDMFYMKEREERREEWTKEFEERRKRSDKIAYRSSEETKRLVLREKFLKIHETDLEKVLV